MGCKTLTNEDKDWDGLPCFFEVGNQSKIPFDLFAASFYLISRYEEHLPHLKDEWGRFVATESVAYQNNFLERPLVDFWIAKFSAILSETFPELKVFCKSKGKISSIGKVVSPYKYKHKSFFANLLQWIKALLQLNFWAIVEQPFVLLWI